MTPTLPVAPPGARFNFAQHLIGRNLARPAKPAYIDDQGSLSYGDLAGHIRRLAAALLASGVRREERVLLLMHDCSDWPVSFLGAMYAGIVPVAVNTLLTPDDYAYMLQHSGRRRPSCPMPCCPRCRRPWPKVATRSRP